MTFFRHYLGIGFVFCCIVAMLVSCASSLQKADKLAMTEPESAIASYKQIMEAKPGSEDAKRAHLGIASTYYNRIENYEKGLEVYEEIAEAYPGTEISGEANWAIAMHYFQAKDYEKARGKFAKVTQEMPGTEKASDAALAIAKCYEELKNFDEAASLYDEFSKTHPKHRYAAQAGLDAGRIYDRELSNSDKAVEAYTHVASEYALSSSGREARESLTDMGVDVSELLESTEEETQAADTAPQTTMTRSRTRRVRASNVPRADIGSRQREDQQTRSVSKDFGVDPLELLPVVSMDSQGTMYDAMFMFANMNLQSHQYKEAGALYEKAIELAGTKPWDNAAMAYFGLAKSYKGIGMDDKAAQMFKEAVKRDRKVIDSMITTGETYYGDEEYEDALSAYETALGVAYHKDADIYYNIGLTYQKLGDADKELEAFERSVALKPSNNDDAIQHMAEVLYYRKKDATRAEMYDKEARGQGSNDYKVQLELANLSYKYAVIFSKEQDRDKQSDSCYSWAKIKYNNAERLVKTKITDGLKKTIIGKLQGELDNGNIPGFLRQEFESNGILLSQDATVSTEERSATWLINDGNKTYSVKKKEDRLNLIEYVGDSSTSPDSSREGSDLELVDWSWSTTSGNYVEAKGQVKNISDRSLSNVEAVATFYDENKDFITFGTALIEFNPILAGQTSPFLVMEKHNPAMRSTSVEFKFLGGEKIRTFQRHKATERFIADAMARVTLKQVSEAAALGNQLELEALQEVEPLLGDFRFVVSRGAISQVRRNQIEAAQKQLDELKVYDPNATNSAEFHYAMGVLALAQGNQDAGMAEIKKAFEIDPEHKEAAEMLKVPAEAQETAQSEASE